MVSWSSLEWQRLPRQVGISKVETIGTIFDQMVHLVNAYLLAAHLSAVEVILGLALVHVGLNLLLYNPRFVHLPASCMRRNCN